MSDQQAIAPSEAARSEGNPTDEGLRKRLVEALIYGTDLLDGVGLAVDVAAIVEDHVRAHFDLTAAQYDLWFTDMAREIEQLVIDELADAIDFDDAIAAMMEAVADDDDDDEAVGHA